MPILRVISGGQTGVDQAGLRAAKAAGLSVGGTAAQGWMTEDGPAPWLADYGLVECEEPGYPARTEANARDGDGTLWIGDANSPGGRTTLRACREHGKPVLIVVEGQTKPSDVVVWIEANEISTLNVAGNRESTQPGIGARAEAFLGRVFRSAARSAPASDPPPS